MSFDICSLHISHSAMLCVYRCSTFFTERLSRFASLMIITYLLTYTHADKAIEYILLWHYKTYALNVVMSPHRNFSREGQGTDDMASPGARAYNGGLGAELPAGSTGRAPGQGVRG